ncbi:hypothetical protein MASR2M48_13870 [Spirochaetota bacterium]
MFEILPAPGVRLSKIANLCDNIALRLAASSVRIVAPIPGKHAVGIEVPNEKRSIVSFKEIVESEVFKNAKMEVPVVLGVDITGECAGRQAPAGTPPPHSRRHGFRQVCMRQFYNPFYPLQALL